MRVPKNTLVCIMLIILICGCAGSSKDLLARDYLHMSNDELLTYYHQLSDEIDRCVSSSNRTSVGVGTGFGLGWLGIGLGVSKGVPTCNPDELRRRRVAVRLELQHRGVSP
ncbi:MAG: hypothetical protein LLG43_12555 [Deltaproteobacteria bacterium]|nr:hypothetical protein [Deltaproteobacteria bacterium]